MKIGDTVPVTIAGQVVANAAVKELSDGTATLVVPATLVVMATRTELTAPTPTQSGTETVITGVDQNGVERSEGAVAVDNVDNDNSNNTNTTEQAKEDNVQSTTDSNVSTQAETSESETSENTSGQTPTVQDTSTSVETNSEVKPTEVNE